MPSYKVLSKGFINGKLYDPEGKRPFLHNEKSFPKVKGVEQVPSWLQPIKSETATQRKKREKSEKQNQEEVDQTNKDIGDVRFVGAGAQTAQTVQTL